MRRTYNAKFVFDENDKFVGLNLGADFCAEHEWGIAGIEQTFGIDTTKIGITGRTITRMPNCFRTLEFQQNYKKFLGLYCSKSGFYGNVDNKEFKNYLPNPYGFKAGSCDYAAAWDENGFSVVISAEYREYFDDILIAMQENRLSIFIKGTANSFGRCGLCLYIVDRIPKSFIDSMQSYDEDVIALNKAADKTQIAQKLRKAGLQYFALSPHWAKDIHDLGPTKYDVAFWLNPMNQTKYRAGWMRVEDLEDWIKGKGRVINNR